MWSRDPHQSVAGVHQLNLVEWFTEYGLFCKFPSNFIGDVHVTRLVGIVSIENNNRLPGIFGCLLAK